MKKILLVWATLFVYSSGLYALSMRGERQSVNYNIVSMSAKIIIQCENREKAFIKKANNLYYTSKYKSFTSFEKAAKYACDLKFKKSISKKSKKKLRQNKKLRKNARLRKNAIVCRTQKSAIYLLKNNTHFRSVMQALQSKNVYKNCFIGRMNYKVAVTNHYHNENLMYDYYKMQYGDNNGDNVRYVPIQFVKPLSKDQKYKRKSIHKTKTRKEVSQQKVTFKKNRKPKIIQKKYKKEKITKGKTYVRPKHKQIKNTRRSKTPKKSYVAVKNEAKVIRYVDTPEEVSDTSRMHRVGVVDNNAYDASRKASTLSAANDSYDQAEDEPKVTYTTDNTSGIEVYRCSVSSIVSGKIYTGQHPDKEHSKDIAFKNCQSEQMHRENCQFEHCFILKLM